MFGELIALLLSSRDAAHKLHWNTVSFAQHKTLNEFYDSILELTDTLMETYQGRKGRVEIPPLLETGVYSETPLAMLKKHLHWIENNRYKAIPKTDSALQNIIDEIVGQYLQTLYLLTLK